MRDSNASLFTPWSLIPWLIFIDFFLFQTGDEGVQNGTHNSGYASIQECSSNGASWGLALLLLWKTGLLGYGLCLAWQTRNVTLPAMRDSPSIIISIFCTLLLSAPTFMLTTLLRHTLDGVYITEILIITICTVVVQMTVFLPKVSHCTFFCPNGT